jgi:hypothetical protein
MFETLSKNGDETQSDISSKEQLWIPNDWKRNMQHNLTLQPDVSKHEPPLGGEQRSMKQKHGIAPV